MTFKSAYLPAGLVVAMAAGLSLPAPGAWVGGLSLPGLSIQHLLVVGIFLLSGYKLRGADFRFGRAFTGALAVSLLINLVLGPVAGVGVAKALGFAGGAFLGLVVMSSVPTTLSSGIVIVGNAGGNNLWALMLTVILTFAGVLAVPFTLAAALGVGVDIDLPVWPLFLKTTKIVLVPLLAGIGLRRLLGRKVPGFLEHYPSTAIILVVWMTVSGNAEGIRATPLASLLLLAVAGLAVHGVLLGLSALGGAALRLAPPDRIAILFIASQKTLPIALSVLLAIPADSLGGASAGLAAIVCVLFHFGQILLDSSLAARIRAGNQAPAA